jgi:hypothetical protein
MKKPRRTVSKSTPITMDERVVSAFMTIPPDSSFFRSWLWICLVIDTGAGEPDADHIVALLRNGEPPPPGETTTLKYIADLIDGARGRGRPRKNPVQVEQHKREQARRDVADIKANGLAHFAKNQHHGGLESATDRYRKARKTLRVVRDEWDERIENLRQRFNAGGGKMTKEEVTARVLASGLKPPAEE